MGTINIFNSGTTGVDGKSNPLFLKNEKAHSAVNLAWEEGRCFTRPGFRYHSLGFAGQFQGACLFTPALGISAQAFALPLAGLVTVVGGKVRINDSTGGEITCNPITLDCGDGFAGRGEVNVFGAENHLIIQNRNSNTFWWSGNGPATESRGMDDETYWVDDEVPCIRFTPETPEADIPDCDKFPCDGEVCTLHISDIEVTGPTTATFKIYNSGTSEATVTGFLATPPTGVSFDPAELVIPAGTDEEVTVTSSSHDLEVLGLEVSTVSNVCGTVGFEIPPPNPPVPECIPEILSSTTINSTTARIVIRNAGNSTLAGVLVTPASSRLWSLSPGTPYNILSGDIVEVTITSLEGEVYGVPYTITTACGSIDVPGVIPEAPPSGGCSYVVEVHPSFSSGTFDIVNTGDSPIVFTSVSDDGGLTYPFLSVPFTVIVGGAHSELWNGVSAGVTVTLTSDCGGEYEFLIG